LLKDIQGRILDFIITKDGRYVSPASIISRLQDVRGLDQFKVVQNQDASIDIRVRIAAGLEIPTRVKLEQICTELFSDTPVRIIHVAKIDYALGRKFRIVESSLTNRWPESQVA
jgi:long-subunit acyl-CoA synthetase (AMP-forming)